MGKKVQPYTVFAQEYARQHNMSMPQAFNAAGAAWRSLSEEEKLPYKNKASAINNNKKPVSIDVRINRGDLNEEMDTQREENYLRPTRERWSEDFVQRCDEADFLNQPIYLISFNVMCAVNGKDCIPNEIGVVKFTFQNGIEQEYHRFIACGDIPLGYAGIAREHQEKTHRIPPESTVLGNRERVTYSQLVQDLGEMMNDDEKYKLFHGPTDTDGIRPLFTFPGELEEEILEQTRSCLRTIGNEVKNKNFAPQFDVLDIVKLMYNCFKKVNQPNVLPQICFDRVRTAVYDFTANTRCEFHDEVDVNFCALGIAKKLAYCLADNLLNYLGVEVTPNHVPKPAEEESCEIVGDNLRAFRGNRRDRPRDGSQVSGLEFSADNNDPSLASASRSVESDDAPIRVPSGIGRGRASRK